MKKEMKINEMLNNYNLENVTVEAKFAEIDAFCDDLCDKMREIIDFIEDKISGEIKFEKPYDFPNDWLNNTYISIKKKDNELVLITTYYTPHSLLRIVNESPSIWELHTIWIMLKEVLEKLKDTTTTELCDICNEEVEISNTFDVHICPNCGNPILPCSICVGHKCSNCPLREEELSEYQMIARKNYCKKE